MKGLAPELDELIARIGLDDDDVRLRSRFLDMQPQDLERMNQASAMLEDSHRDFIDRLYRHLEHFEPMARILRDPTTLQRLKTRQQEYYQQLWSGPYGNDYLRDRLHIGLVHQRVGIGLKWYLGAYRLYLDHMLELLGGGESLDTFRSLLKAVFFDISLAADTYTAAQHRALEQSEARFARALRGANDGIWDWDVAHDRLYLSSRWTDMLGFDHDSFGDSSACWFSRVHQDDLPGLHQAIQAHLAGESSSLHYEYRIRKHNGQYLWVLVRGVLEPGSQRMAGSQTDISQNKEVEQQLRHAARHDPLTGLANRTRLEELLGQSLQRQRMNHARHSAVLFVDLDRFKLINDSLGHAIGDEVLVEVAHRLKRCLRVGDHLIRFGGDEFVALLNDLSCLEDADRIAQRMLDALYQPLHVQEKPLMVSASIGIALLDADAQSNVLQAADLALYRAKASGKAQFARYSDELRSHADHRLRLESALGLALRNGEFELHYQPICHIDGVPRVVGVEALLRWHSDSGLVPPTEFIPILEESGLIVPVGEWVLRESCRQTRAWQLTGHEPLYCSVNLSSRQLHQPEFARCLASILEETGLPPTSLILEITESLLMQDTADTLMSLREIAALGVRLALDDFGTGYCSLGYLTRFPLHILKVDRSFIDGAPSNPELGTISRAIIGLGTNLGLQVIAEGVEDTPHLDFLRTEGCSYAQGFWFSRPRPAKELQGLLDGNERPHGGNLNGETPCKLAAGNH
ncbi:EAL domain-containing protein [Stutzerimonas tarimensis]|uniref:Diguanylate cyclase DosC n=1 Tax=Stutzerimonas tarimensis TaxID=1507735 RepID=A0ABV7T9J5_9GAMM